MNNNDYFTKTVYNGRWKRFTYNAGDWYEEVYNPENWNECPNCGKLPLIWVFDNGRQTACGCGEDKYNGFRIKAESIVSVAKRNNGNISSYNPDELRLNWNEYCNRNK